MKSVITLIAVTALLLIWTGPGYAQQQNQQVITQQVAPPPPPHVPPQRVNRGLTDEMRQQLANEIINNKNLNLNNLIRQLQQIRNNRINRPPVGAGLGQIPPDQVGLGGQVIGGGLGRGVGNLGLGLGPGQGAGKGAGTVGQGTGPGQGLGRGAVTVGRGLGQGQGRGLGAANINQGLLGRGLGAGAVGFGRGRGAGAVGFGRGRGAGAVIGGRGLGAGRGVGNLGRGMGFGGGRGINLRLRDGSCNYYQGLGTGLGVGRGLGRGVGVGLGQRIIRDDQPMPEEDVLKQLEQLDDESLDKILNDLQQQKEIK